MRYQVCAFNEDGLQWLGNLDGQGIFECKIPERCTWFKRLATLKTLNNRVQLYIVYKLDGGPYSNGTEYKRIANQNHPSWY